MTTPHSTSTPPVLVAIDIAKARHDVLVELPGGRRRKMVVRNQLSEFRQLAKYLRSLGTECLIALEPTADYHRCLAYFLGSQGFELRLASSLAVSRTREALHNSWDKNDPKDARSSSTCCAQVPRSASTTPSGKGRTTSRSCRRLITRCHCARRACSTA